MIDRENPLPLTRQAELLKLSRSSLYYKARPVSPANLAIMRRIDELHLECPFASGPGAASLVRDLPPNAKERTARRRPAACFDVFISDPVISGCCFPPGRGYAPDYRMSLTFRAMASMPASRFRPMKLNTHRTIAQPGSPAAKISPPMAHKAIGAFTQCGSPKCSITMPPPSALATAMLIGATASSHIVIVGALYLRLYRPRRCLGGDKEADPLNGAIDDRLVGSGT